MLGPTRSRRDFVSGASIATFAGMGVASCSAVQPGNEKCSKDSNPVLFANIRHVQIPDNVKIIQTAGYSRLGTGSARYVEAPSTGETSYRTKSEDGRWWQLNEAFVFPEMLGALADGINDDSAAINAALEYCPAVHLTHSNYAIASPIHLLRGSAIFGAATFDDITRNGSKITLLDNANCAMLTTPAARGEEATSYQGLENVVFDGNANGQSEPNIALKWFGLFVGSWMHRVFIKNNFGPALVLDRGSDVELQHIWILKNVVPSGYAFDMNPSLSGDQRRGVMHLDHFFVENTLKVKGGDRNNPAHRGYNCRFRRANAIYLGNINTEGGITGVDIESCDIVSVGLADATAMGYNEIPDAALFRLLDSQTQVLDLGPMSSGGHETGFAWVKKAIGVDSDSFPDLPMGETPRHPGYLARLSASQGTKVLPPTTIVDELIIAGGGSTAGKAVLRLAANSKDASHLAYLEVGDGVTSLGANHAQSGGKPKDYLRIESFGDSRDNIGFSEPVRLSLRATPMNLAERALTFVENTPTLHLRGRNLSVVACIIGSGAPTFAPDFVGQMYLDQAKKRFYAASGNSSAKDWCILN